MSGGIEYGVGAIALMLWLMMTEKWKKDAEERKNKEADAAQDRINTRGRAQRIAYTGSGPTNDDLHCGRLTGQALTELNDTMAFPEWIAIQRKRYYGREWP